jgi:hypothetical protein
MMRSDCALCAARVMPRPGAKGAGDEMTWDPDDKEKTALHEAGHAVVGGHSA